MRTQPPSTTSASSEHFERVYEQLHTLARRHFARAGSGVTLQATALVHEVYLRLARHSPDAIKDREHFLAIAATAMRQILVDRARRRQAAKRGGDWARVSLCHIAAVSGDSLLDTLALNDVITRLAELNPRQAQVVEMRVFTGMTIAEVATALAISASTVDKDWRQARAWMRLELERGQVA